MAIWRREAACRDTNTELFFPVGKSGPARVQTAHAKAVCAPCPVKTECLEEALENGLEGVWGGTTDDERRAARAGVKA
jgi:WhiB family redox-sensing transcriptional regulator